MSPLFDIKEKVVVFAGRQGRLGLSLADCLVQEGAIVVLLGDCVEEGQALVDAMVLKGGEACFFKIAPTEPFNLLQVQEDIMLEYGRIDALVYELEGLPGQLPKALLGRLLDATPLDTNKTEERRLETLLMTVRTFLKPMLRQQEGRIIFLLDYPLAMKYIADCSHTLALNNVAGLTKSLAGELVQRFGPAFRVNTLMAGSDNPANFHPEELQGSIQFLLSEASCSMTGCVMLVDGGFHIFADTPALTQDFSY